MFQSTTAVLFAFALLLSDGIRASSPAEPDAIWSSIIPSARLQYHSCYGHLQCARLMVPLDWNQSSNASTAFPTTDNQTAILAVIKLPAIVSPSHPRYGGTIITNPGGPGASGVVDLALYGQQIRKEFDSAQKHFDLVSFDPRGVLFSTPHALCFEDDVERERWNAQANAIGCLDSGEQAITLLWARAKALGRLCEGEDGRREGIFRHMSTAVVARDMLALVDEIESHHQLSQVDVMPEPGAQAPLHERVEMEAPLPKLMFWGFSGGTILGATFATMYPDRVERMVLDGVVNADDYMSNSWITTFENTEEVVQTFYQTCFDAGAMRCALFHADGPQAIEEDVKAILEQARHRPLATLRQTSSLIPEIVTYSDIKKFIFWSLFSPLHTFPVLAQGLADIKFGNGTLVLQATHPVPRNQCVDHSPDTSNNVYPGFLEEVLPAISCSDSTSQSSQTLSSFKSYLRDVESRSPTIGAIWAQHNRLACTGWTIRPAWRFTGPFGWNHTTSSPTRILFVGNTRDPVTPLASAKYMAEKFSGSAVLVQDCAGHGYNAAPSRCREEVVRKYFDTGEVESDVVECAVEKVPFEEGTIGYYRHTFGWT
ncbi:Tripeptidyl aminopeptidase 2 [Phlyctema vagabunda]|uniref:Tripeptidyl aminopeptidase 2 n=1 Tax=Phlyctema vagabunda TaxID=108571 RepID=A0ABR4PAX0_9HELO